MIIQKIKKVIFALAFVIGFITMVILLVYGVVHLVSLLL